MLVDLSRHLARRSKVDTSVMAEENCFPSGFVIVPKIWTSAEPVPCRAMGCKLGIYRSWEVLIRGLTGWEWLLVVATLTLQLTYLIIFEHANIIKTLHNSPCSQRKLKAAKWDREECRFMSVDATVRFLQSHRSFCCHMQLLIKSGWLSDHREKEWPSEHISPQHVTKSFPYQK